jgi:hypothetical protein
MLEIFKRPSVIPDPTRHRPTLEAKCSKEGRSFADIPLDMMNPVGPIGDMRVTPKFLPPGSSFSATIAGSWS